MLKLFWLNNFYVRCSIIWHSFIATLKYGLSKAKIWHTFSDAEILSEVKIWHTFSDAEIFLERSENLTHVQRRWNITSHGKYDNTCQIWHRLPNMTLHGKYDIACQIRHRMENMTYVIFCKQCHIFFWHFLSRLLAWRNRVLLPPPGFGPLLLFVV